MSEKTEIYFVAIGVKRKLIKKKKKKTIENTVKELVI